MSIMLTNGSLVIELTSLVVSAASMHLNDVEEAGCLSNCIFEDNCFTESANANPQIELKVCSRSWDGMIKAV